MAARLVQNISDDYLSCPICLLRFKEPRKLPCEHTFCTGCLQQHINNSVQERSQMFHFSCPLCRSDVSSPPDRSINVRAWASYFPLDNLIQDLVQTLSLHERQLPPQHLQQLNLHNKCKVHTENNLDLFCLHHTLLICTKCAEIDHNVKNCVCLQIDEAFDKLKPRVGELRQLLNKQASKLESCSHIDTEFNKQRTEAIRSVNKIEERLHTFYQRCIHQLAVQRSDIEKLNREHIEERKTFYLLAAQLLETQCRLESLCENSDKRQFLSEIQKLIKSGAGHEKTLSELSLNNKTPKVKFTINRDLDKFLDSFSAIGFIDKTSSRFALDDFPSSLEHPGLPVSLNSILNRQEVNRTMGQSSVKLTTVRKFSGQLPSDEERCWLVKILVLPDSHICTLDKTNAKLKRYTENGQLVASLNLVDQPHCMDLIKTENNIVITKPDKEMLEFVSIGSNQLSVSKYIPSAKKYFGVSYINNDTMAVSSWSQNCVDIIDMNGWILTSISSDIFEIPDMLCCIGNAEIAVIDKGSKLTCVDQTGCVKWTVDNNHTMNNISISENGEIYICCKDAKKVCTLNNSIFSHFDIDGRKPLDVFVRNSQIIITHENGEIEIATKD